MPLPYDSDYVSFAPKHVRDNSQFLRKMLSMNLDPYAPDTYRPELIRAIESEVSLLLS